MVDIPFDTVAGIPPPKWVRSSSIIPKSWWTRYVFSQATPSFIAIQYSITAMATEWLRWCCRG